MRTGGRLRRLGSLVPVVVLGALAGLLWAHDATWSVVLGLVLVVLAVLLAIAAVTLRWAVLVGLIGAALFTVGTTMTVSSWWMRAFGRDGTATVSEVQHHVVRTRAYDDYALRLTGGGDVAGPLRDYRTGSLHVGDTVSVRYDPTGVIRFPRELDDRRGEHDAGWGPVVLTAGLIALVVGVMPTPAPDPPAPEHPGESIEDLGRRLAAERGDDPSAGG